ncbi:hypothetical protein MPER_01768, partial [Moniliophthora perniciosa FA553]
DLENRLRRLDHVLTISTTYSKMLQEAMESRRVALAKLETNTHTPSKNASKGKGTPTTRSRKRVLDDSDEEMAATSAKRQKHEFEDPEGETKNELDAACIFKQPDLITGAKLKDYQLEGLQWMVSLHHSGISGILGMF